MAVKGYEYLCYNCMEPLNAPGEECPKCHYDNRQRSGSKGVLPACLLKGQYFVGRKLGDGGFGVTYIGYDLNLEQKVAIKEYFPRGIVLRDDDGISVRLFDASDETDYRRGRQRTLEEAQFIAKNGDIPNVVRVYNAFSANGTIYIVMEYIDGQTLTERVKLHGVMDYREAFECLCPIMKALEKIHAKHIVHRDVSPDNIMIRKGSNEPVLLDFGAAHRFTDENRSVSLRPGYAPPEQYSSLKLPDARSDEYALCATFYYQLSGKKPLDANARKYSGEDIDPLIQLCPDMPIRFAQAIEKGMSLRIEDRFASVEELRSELERGLEKASPIRGRVALIAAGGVVVLGVAAAAMLLPKNGPVAPNQETSTPTPTATAETIETPAVTETPALPTETPVPTAPSSDGDGFTVVYARENVLMQARPGEEEVVFSGASPVMGSETIAREQISSIEFCAELPADIDTMLESGAAWDVSEAQNGRVLAWTGDPDESGRLPLYIGGDGGVVAPDDCSALVSGFVNVRRIDFNGYFDTRQVASMYAMFYDCASLQQLDMSSLKTNAATDMAFMFRGCASLEELDLSSFDTRQVTDMYAMFYGCKALRTLDVSSFAMETVIDAGFMFGGCASLEELDLSRFDTQNVTNMQNMFKDCASLKALNLSAFRTGMVTDMTYMFSGCASLEELDLSSFDTHKVTNMLSMFDGCTGLKALNLNAFRTDAVTDMSFMFSGCASLEELDLSGFDTGSVTNMYAMFYGCKALRTLDVSSFAMGTVIDAGFMFGGCVSLEELDLGRFDTQNVTNMQNMFKDCASLKALNLSAFRTALVTDMTYMFSGCTSLKELNLSGFDTGNVTNMYAMFSGCAGLRSLNLSGFNTQRVMSMESMFEGCSSLDKLDLSRFDTRSVTSMHAMFSGCMGLRELNLSGFDTKNVEDMSYMFYGCTSLRSLNRDGFDKNRVQKDEAMFEGCALLN